MKTKTSPRKSQQRILTDAFNAEADRYHVLGLEQAKRNLFTPDPLTERLAREHFVRSEAWRNAAKLASGN